MKYKRKKCDKILRLLQEAGVSAWSVYYDYHPKDVLFEIGGKPRAHKTGYYAWIADLPQALYLGKTYKAVEDSIVAYTLKGMSMDYSEYIKNIKNLS